MTDYPFIPFKCIRIHLDPNDNNVSWRNAFVLIFATINVQVGLVRAFSLGRD